MDLAGEVSILSTIHGTVHILMACILLGDTVTDMADGMIHSITVVYFLLGVGDTVDGTHHFTVAGAILGIMEDMVVTMVAATDMDMEVVFMTDTILDSPIIDQVEVLEFTDHQQVEDQVLLTLQDELVVQQEAV